MKKIIGTILIISMIFICCVPAAALESFVKKEAKVLLEEDFNDLASLQALPDYKAYGFAYDGEGFKDISSPPKDFLADVTVSDGKLNVLSRGQCTYNEFSPPYKEITRNIPPSKGTRISLYKMPDTEYVRTAIISLDFTIKGIVDQTPFAEAGILFGDNGMTRGYDISITEYFSRLVLGRERKLSFSLSSTIYGEYMGNLGNIGIPASYSMILYYNILMDEEKGEDTTKSAYFCYVVRNNDTGIVSAEEVLIENTREKNFGEYVGVYAHNVDVSFDRFVVYDNLEAYERWSSNFDHKLFKQLTEKSQETTTETESVEPLESLKPESTVGITEITAEVPPKANKLNKDTVIYVVSGVIVVSGLTTIGVVLAKKRKRKS